MPRLLERTQIQRETSIDWEALDAWIEPPVSGAEILRLRRLTGSLARPETRVPGVEPRGKVN
jgi:hypothetical protein